MLSLQCDLHSGVLVLSVVCSLCIGCGSLESVVSLGGVAVLSSICVSARVCSLADVVLPESLSCANTRVHKIIRIGTAIIIRRVFIRFSVDVCIYKINCALLNRNRRIYSFLCHKPYKLGFIPCSRGVYYVGICSDSVGECKRS